MAARKRKAAVAAEAIRQASRPTVSDNTGDDIGAAEMNRRVSEALSTAARPTARGTTETVVVLKGTLCIAIEEAEYDLLTGDSLFFQADVPHTYENRSSHEARCINVIAYERL